MLLAGQLQRGNCTDCAPQGEGISVHETLGGHPAIALTPEELAQALAPTTQVIVV